jgi:hypothetical protein
MPARRLQVEGREWEVYPSGFLTQYVGDEFGVVFATGHGDAREVRVTRYSPRGARSRERSLAEMDDAALRQLFDQAQPSVRSPEAGYRP